jgi:hypothetical protein
VRDLERRAAAAPATDPWYQGCLNNALCIRHIRGGGGGAARAAAHRAMGHYRDAGALYGQVLLRVHLGIIPWSVARLGDALDDFGVAARLAESLFPGDEGLVAISELLQAGVHYLCNRLDMAARLVQRALPRVERHEGWLEVYWRGYTVDTRLAYEREGLAAALARLERALATADRLELRRLRQDLLWRQVELLTLAGELQRAAELETRLVAAGTCRGWREDTVAAMTRGRLRIFEGDPEAALALVRPHVAEVAEQGGRAYLVKLQAIEALALAELGRVDIAYVIGLERAVIP